MSKYLTNNYLGIMSRDALRVFRYIIENKKATIVEMEKIVFGKKEGRHLSGILSSFSKKDGEPLIIPAGYTKATNRTRVKLWILNPKFKKSFWNKLNKELDNYKLELNEYV